MNHSNTCLMLLRASIGFGPVPVTARTLTGPGLGCRTVTYHSFVGLSLVRHFSTGNQGNAVRVRVSTSIWYNTYMRVGDKVQYVGDTQLGIPSASVGVIVRIDPDRYQYKVHVAFPGELPIAFMPEELAVVEVANQ